MDFFPVSQGKKALCPLSNDLWEEKRRIPLEKMKIPSKRKQAEILPEFSTTVS